MDKKRSVFLFGAGATLPWGSPSTPDLTELILTSGFKIKGENKTITRFIYETLIAAGYQPWEANFETIINVIEELIVYYGHFDYSKDKKLPSLMSCFFQPTFEEQIFNFSIKGNKEEHGYVLQIPAGSDYYASHNAYQREPPKQFFLQHLLSVLLTAIDARISEFAYHTHSHSIIKFDSPISKLFAQWMHDLSAENILRLYTLNYDRIFKLLIEQTGVEVFEGFEYGERVEHALRYRADIKRILSDTDSHVHYNLHGSAFWEVLGLDNALLPNPEIAFVSIPRLSINNTPATYQVEKGKTLSVTNIITGYQKAQKAMLAPVKQMQAAFDRDCCFADEIYIVGYSLGDEHINESLKTALRHNPQVKITIIDPFFIKNNLDLEIALRFYPYSQAGSLSATNIRENVNGYLDGALIVYTLTFEEFLQAQIL